MKYSEKKTDLIEKGMKRITDMPEDEIRNLFPHLVSDTVSGCRKRLFSTENVFFLFLWQVINMASCVETVQRALLRFSIVERKKASPSSSAYCQGRKRLTLKYLENILSGTAVSLERKVNDSFRWHGKKVNVVDGTTISMPDTPENQRIYPQLESQKPGCGFPIMRMLTVFSLASGALLSYV